MKPLESVKVLDLTNGNPYPGTTLANYGAEVLHIEKPGTGDSMRYRGGKDGKEGPYYAYYGRDKLSVTLDYTKPEGAEILKKLIAEYDIMIMNVPEAEMAKYGFSYDEVKAINKAVIYGVLTPYGEKGPWKDQPDYDLLVMSKTGLQEKTGFPERPTKFGAPVAYIYSSRHLTFGILAGYLKAMETGEGCKVSVSVWQTVFSLDDTFKGCFQGLEVLPVRLGNGFPTTNPTDTFKCKNGWFSLSIGSDDQWLSFAHAAKVPLWYEDERYAHDPARSMDNYFGDLDQQLREYFAKITIEEADAICQEAVVPGGPCNGVKEIMENNPQVEDRGMIVKVDGMIQYGRPAKFVGEEDEPFEPAHALGQDNEAVLASLGYDGAKLAELKAAGVM